MGFLCQGLDIVPDQVALLLGYFDGFVFAEYGSLAVFVVLLAIFSRAGVACQATFAYDFTG
ncbi:hypothetical protein O3299_26775 [Janthinobacterium sp. SUN176]|uniref:hypothetical protein n=1 Tax=Janthinobacterium sp. SUN176 TaxID=3014788 RepID=UPI00271441CC|nr:hypothetical protein [Janthinobacterium sp. SUN176]MDO8075155.1 hypothetical protein [Janthinobacterium sp. SUN176]